MERVGGGEGGGIWTGIQIKKNSQKNFLILFSRHSTPKKVLPEQPSHYLNRLLKDSFFSYYMLM